MIRVTKLNGSAVMLNPDWIQSVESTPDTLITLTTGFTMLVLEKTEDVADAFMRYKARSGTLLRMNPPEKELP